MYLIVGTAIASLTVSQDTINLGTQQLLGGQSHRTHPACLWTHQLIMGSLIIFIGGEGEGQALADRHLAFKYNLGRQSLYNHWLITDITSFNLLCLSLYCMSIAVMSVK
jgi:hypothetical protein